MSYSVVEYYGENSKYQCGYCKQSSSCSSYGMWAHKLSCQDYQELIDRGWRRSGCYCYKPMMDVTCCPSYTIKCDAINFRLNKSHKKIIKRMNKFLRDGLKETSEQDAQSNIDEIATHDGSACDQEHTEVPSMQPRVLDPDLLNTLTHVNSEKRSPSADDKTSALPIPPLSGVVNTSTHTSDSSISNQPKKAKLRRIERKREKLQKKGLSGPDIEQLMQSNNRKSAEKSLEEFLSESPQDNDSPAHRLKVKQVNANDGATAATFKLYSLYQQSIHNDPASKLSMDRFKRFLVKSPLKPFQGFGTFHQQYWLDDRLIAVGVIDVLPNCVSSVYFFYDPEYKFLSLGTYGSLRELAYTRSLYKEYPSISNYYMGFYIHSCPKMRYKSNLQPSYLLCPEAYTWHLLDRTVVAKLDASKYSRLNDDPTAQDTNKATEQDVNDVLLIFGRSCMTYTQYLTVVGKELPILFEYARLVGKSCAKKMMLYRV
ncbi:arginyl-tRNA--protein transferase 1 isoform X3 [Anopheles gambiae]|uniref:arginyl-tRNA--protein transferase 1 isoform X3 n=1 Tax=Anopheles coluzzii TaxID=1518534 RepID=UPI0020FFAC4B|nr:arginyl-tRNA--protein transferase 1 isoform X3 [Anopheles coluzzii]XP_061517677.1 arginyl-tRNA--protein transferase 1 isoform X3 [Anopheles gambiae]